MDTKKLVKELYAAIEDKKGENIRIIDISGVSVIADYFIIANGNNVNQVQAIADSVDEIMVKNNLPAGRIEGYNSANWILMDYGNVIVHIFSKEDRLFYDLERIWRDGKNIEIGDL
ncbi:MAG: ribosome silencing factor [Butyrivibrio sp.]